MKSLMRLLVLTVLFAGQLKASSNCGCDSTFSVKQAIEDASIVITGTCLDITPNTIKGGLNIVFQIDSSWKRGVEMISTVHTNSANQCGFPFERGKKYIVFANKRHQTVETSECEPNTIVNAASAPIFALLGNGIAPGRPTMARNLNLLIVGLAVAGLLFLGFVVLRKKFKK